MKRWMALAGILILGTTAIVVTERRKVDTQASPAAVLNFVADSERDLTRMPMDFTRLSDDEEIRAGDQLAKYYESLQGTEERSENETIVSGYLTEVGTRVSSQAHRKLPYKFHYLPKNEMVNAFALPGGHVFVGAGLLELMDSEDQLAAVLGHEIEHIDHYHCAERIQKERALRRLPLGDLVSLPIAVFEAGYSKDQELEANREGTRLSVESGYSATGAIRMFAKFGQWYDESQRADKRPQDEAARVMQQTLEGYFRSHPLPAERIAQVQKLIASEGWAPKTERDLRAAFVFKTVKARQALDLKNYKRAEELANQSLRMRPDQTEALDVLASAQFSQANFSGSANTLRKLLEIEPANEDATRFYARALAAADGKSALSEYQKWEAGLSGAKTQEMKIAEAGLSLLNGKPSGARELENSLNQEDNARAFRGLGELGWWHYLAGDYPRAAELLELAVQRLPDNAKIRTRLAWAEIEMKRYRDALQMLESIPHGPESESLSMMTRAVARWRAGEKDEAMVDFTEAMMIGKDDWQDPRLIRALYSPAAAKSIEEMKEEAERRRAKEKAAAAGRRSS